MPEFFLEKNILEIFSSLARCYNSIKIVKAPENTHFNPFNYESSGKYVLNYFT